MVKNIKIYLIITWTVASNAACLTHHIQLTMIDNSPHAIQLKDTAKMLMKVPYADVNLGIKAKPTAEIIIHSLQKIKKSASIALDVYAELLTKAVSTLHDDVMWRDDKLSAYFLGQFDINKNATYASYYTTLLVLAHPSIALPTDICKKVASFIKVEAQVFKADILVMLRIASLGIPETLHPDLYDFYKQLCESKVCTLPTIGFNNTKPMIRKPRSIRTIRYDATLPILLDDVPVNGDEDIGTTKKQ